MLIAVGAVAFACGEAGQSMTSGAGAMDGSGATSGGGATNGTGATNGSGGNGAGASGGGAPPAAQVIPVNCPAEGGFVLTNVDRGEFGSVTVHSRFRDPWGATDPPEVVDYRSDAIWSINGKILFQCSANDIESWIEVR